MQHELLPRCDYCGAPLPYPGVQFSRREYELFRLIHREEPRFTIQELMRIMKLSRGTVATMIQRINRKIREKGLWIYSRPYRVEKLRYPGT